MPAHEDYERFTGLADELKLEEGEREGFIESSMKRLGYRPVINWTDPEPDNNGGNDGGDFFSRRRNQQSDQGGQGGQTRRVTDTRNRNSGRGNSGHDWQYGG